MHLSAKTSINHVPALMKKIAWEQDSYNLDYGGGKYDTATLYLLGQHKIHNVVYDPYNRSSEFNVTALYVFSCAYGTRTATCANVLCVIEDENEKDQVIKAISLLLDPNEKAYFSVYEGNKSGVSSVSMRKTWQANRRLFSYVPEIQKHFKNVELRKSDKMIIAWN